MTFSWLDDGWLTVLNLLMSRVPQSLNPALTIPCWWVSCAPQGGGGRRRTGAHPQTEGRTLLLLSPGVENPSYPTGDGNGKEVVEMKGNGNQNSVPAHVYTIVQYTCR